MSGNRHIVCVYNKNTRDKKEVCEFLSKLSRKVNEVNWLISWYAEVDNGEHEGKKCPECGCLLEIDDHGGYCVYCNDQFTPFEVRSLK